MAVTQPPRTHSVRSAVMLIAGVVLIALGLVCLLLTYRTQRQQRELSETDLLAVAELTALHHAAEAAAGEGVFRTRTEVVGEAQPGPQGPLKAEISGQECVWHSHVVIRRYWTTRRDSVGRTRREEHDEQIAELTTNAPFTVVDATGEVLVDPTGTVPDGVLKVVDRFERGVDEDSKEIKLGELAFGIPLDARDNTVGYRYQEWVLPPGAQVYVLGEATDEHGSLTVRKPTGGAGFVISTRSGEELLAGKRDQQVALTALAMIGFVAGLVLFLIGLIF